MGVLHLVVSRMVLFDTFKKVSASMGLHNAVQVQASCTDPNAAQCGHQETFLTEVLHSLGKKFWMSRMTNIAGNCPIYLEQLAC